MKPAADPVDRKELAKAIAAIDTAKELSSKHREELAALQGEINECNAEINNRQSLIDEFKSLSEGFNDNNPVNIVDVKKFVKMKFSARDAQDELEILYGIKSKLVEKYFKMEKSYSYHDAELERNAVSDCWRVLYTSFLSVFDAQALKELIVIGCASGLNHRMVTENVGLHEYIDHDLLRPFAAKYGIPIYGEINGEVNE